ncbi:MAG: type III-B CRISPR module RAMP protein Cmr4 [Balneolales bacterium]|nr:type III-B CRISPR module RAMP protein Cmr4 [Balneolales bacterium]
MYKQADIMFMYAETSVHVGGGESVGAIDLAIAREKYTDFPFIPSSGVKGAIRDWFEKSGEDKTTVEVLFGPEKDGSEHAGAAVFTDARILLFPVRSLKGVFAWITCPFAIERFARDMKLSGQTVGDLQVPPLSGEQVLAPLKSVNLIDGELVLEEFTYTATAVELSPLSTFFKKCFPAGDEYNYWRNKLDTNLIIMADDEFRDFVKSSTEVQARIRIDSDTKTVSDGALFYQENLPSDTLMYTVCAAQRSMKKDIKLSEDQVFKVLNKLHTNSVQMGGNESIGKGIFNLNFYKG